MIFVHLFVAAAIIFALVALGVQLHNLQAIYDKLSDNQKGLLALVGILGAIGLICGMAALLAI